MKNTSQLDKLVWSVLAGLALGLITLVWLSQRIGVGVTASWLADSTEIGPYGSIWIEFDAEMDKESVASHLRVEPEVSLSIEWLETRAVFRPEAPFDRETRYSIRLSPGSEALDGRQVNTEIAWTFQVRESWIVFLSAVEPQNELFRIPISGGEPEQLTDSGGNVFDFASSPDGQWIAYSVINEETGIDIWIMDREGGNQRILFNCGNNRCIEPTFSPDSSRIAFSRSEAGLSPEEPHGPNRVWIGQRATGESVRLFANTQKIGFSPNWSPDGKKISYFDGIEGKLRILDMESSVEYEFPNYLGQVGSWAPTSDKIVYADLILDGAEQSSSIFLVDLKTRDILNLFPVGATQSNFRFAEWSPTGEWIAVNVSQKDDASEDEARVIPPTADYSLKIDDESGFIFYGFEWDAWGENILYRKTPSKEPFPKHNLALYNLESSEPKILVEGIFDAQWLP